VLAIAYEIVLSVVGINVTPRMCHPLPCKKRYIYPYYTLNFLIKLTQ